MPPSMRSRQSVPKLPTKTLREFTMNDIREMEDLADELDVHIATREFEEAVENIEKGMYYIASTFIEQNIYIYIYNFIMNYSKECSNERIIA
jgi:hypothetical protein